MDDSKLSELRILHRELAQCLEKQNEDIMALRKAVGAIQQALSSDSASPGVRSALSKSYAEHLGSLTGIEQPQPNRTEARSRAMMESLVRKLKEW